MAFDVPIFLAALGITTLEFVEAAAVALALYADSHKSTAFVAVALGTVAVLVPTFIVGTVITLLPEWVPKVVGGVLLAYFGQRLVKSARRSVIFSRIKSERPPEEFEKGIMSTGFSVGAIEAFEAAIVLVGLLPNSYDSASYGFFAGVVLVVIGTYLLRNQVRKLKQANMKIFVSGLLLSFATFWFGEIVSPSFFGAGDLVLIPLFLFFTFVVYKIANRPSPPPAPKTETTTPAASH